MILQGEGYYVARGLSFKEAAFEELECKLTEEQRETYDSAAKVILHTAQQKLLHQPR